MVADAALARKMPDFEHTPEHLRARGLQKGMDGLPGPLSHLLKLINSHSNAQSTPEAEQPATGEELNVTGARKSSRKRSRTQYEEDAEEAEEEEEEEEELVEVESRIEAFKDIPNEREHVDNLTINWPFLEGVFGQREAILEEMQECGAFEVPDQWLRHIYFEGCPSFSQMAALEEKAIREKTEDLGINHDPRLWTMVFSPCQQAMRLDLGLYATTVVWRNNGLFELYSLPEPAWSCYEERNEGILAHLGHPTGAILKHVSGGTNTWSPVFLVGMTKGESEEWCGPLDVDTENPKQLEESWNNIVERTGAEESQQDAFLTVAKEEYEARLSPGGGMSHDKLFAVHPNGAIGFSGMYGAALMFPVQFVPAADSKSARKWARSLQPPPKTMSGRKFLASAAGRWPPLVTLRPKNSLACALAGWTDWSDLAVERELNKLFRAPDQAAVERYIRESRTELCCDTYRAHVEFLNTVGRYYG